MSRDQCALWLALLSSIFFALLLVLRIKSFKVEHRGKSLVILDNIKAVEAPVWLTSVLDSMLQHDKLSNQHFDALIKNHLKAALSDKIRDISVHVHCGTHSPRFVMLNFHTDKDHWEGIILTSYSGDAQLFLKGSIGVFSTVNIPFEVRLSQPRVSLSIRVRESSTAASGASISLCTTPSFSFHLRSTIGGRFGVSDCCFLHCLFTYIIVWKLRQFIKPSIP